MRISKYIPEKLYGFCSLAGDQDSADQVFFHLGAFFPQTQKINKPKKCDRCAKINCVWFQTQPPPILGELVEVTLGMEAQPNKAPKAERVERLTFPSILTGLVETFDGQRGYGFLKGEDGISYHLHRSEVAEGRIPLKGQQVLFYAGTRHGKPRACHVRICPI
jgi:cold shock CspA family protein